MLTELKRKTTPEHPVWPAAYTNRDTGRKYEPLSAEIQQFHNTKTRYTLLAGGLGSGKTTAGAIQALQKIKQALPGAIVSPDFEHFKRSAWPELRAWIPWNCVHPSDRYRGDPAWVPQRTFELHFITPKQNSVTNVSLGGIDDPSSWRGPNLNWFWFDEAGRKKDDQAWRVLIGRIRIGNNPQGWITSTPKWNWLKNVFIDKPSKFKSRFTVQTKDNPFLDKTYVESVYSEYSSNDAKQELEGEFVAPEGLVYSNFNEHNITELEPDPKREIEIAYDDGFVDPRVFLLIQRTANYILVFDEQFHSSHLPRTCIQELLGRCQKNKWPKPVLAIGDPTAIELREEFRLANIAARGERVPNIEGITRLRSLFCNANGQRRLLIQKRCVNLLAEIMHQYIYPETGTRSNTEEPIDRFNHGCDALKYWSYHRARA